MNTACSSISTAERPAEGKTFLDYLNPDSLETLSDCPVEPSLAGTGPGTRVQFERLGYFAVDRDSQPGTLIFNRTVSLRDSWAKFAQKPPAR